MKPRARVREDLFDDAQALLPPKLRPKSRLPQLHYGGLQAPSLRCFASSLPTFTQKDNSTQSKLRQAFAKSLPSPTKFHRPIKCLQSTEEKETIEADRARHQLREIFYGIGKSQANYIAKYITRLFLINISIVLQTALGLGDSLKIYKFGSAGMLVQLPLHTACRGSFITVSGLPSCF